MPYDNIRIVITSNPYITRMVGVWYINPPTTHI